MRATCETWEGETVCGDEAPVFLVHSGACGLDEMNLCWDHLLGFPEWWANEVWVGKERMTYIEAQAMARRELGIR